MVDLSYWNVVWKIKIVKKKNSRRMNFRCTQKEVNQSEKVYI
jgi:hypothetical protein